ncbi:hypothetical protein ABT369_29315 [Dactylosporangium sp. NPDC000244]|uniref:WD40/YVTN/BNR-like repeat-containing protein n=1 Tax=Dactylosporangium sp. NPDC000244 TaxID=3154365 RepID=UPI00332BC7CF
MPDTLVEDEFARFAEAFTGTFRPVPAEAMPRWRRTRRRGALWLAGLGAALVAALSLNALQPAARPAPAPFTDRVVRLEGARGEMAVGFAGRSNGWVTFNDCRAGGDCEHFLGRTTDGGLTWRRVALPELPAQGRLVARPGPASALIGVTGSPTTVWETNDGGLTWRSIVTDGTSAIVVPPSREISGSWKVTHDGLESHAFHSPDRGSTWRGLEPPVGAEAEVRVSADDRDAWAIAARPTRAWRLTPEGTEAEPELPAGADPSMISAVGEGGLLMLVPGRGVGVWRGGTFTPLPAPLHEAALPIVLSDGAITLSMPDGTLIVGGEHEQWVRYTHP